MKNTIKGQELYMRDKIIKFELSNEKKLLAIRKLEGKVHSIQA